MHRFELDGPSGLIEAFEFVGRGQETEPILVVPNGYGVLRYASALGSRLSEDYATVYAVNLRGQGRSEGAVSISGCAQDLREVIPALSRKSGDQRLSLIVHCSAMLYLLESETDSPVWQHIDRILLYAYLHRAALHLDRFHANAQKYSVRVAADVGDLRKFTPKLYGTIPVPYAVVHPKTPEHLRRASLRALTVLGQIGSPVSVATPSDGYDIIDAPQEDHIDAIVSEYMQPRALRSIA